MGYYPVLPVAAAALERPLMRRGVTLIELLVAMVIAGLVCSMVAGWIVHTARQTTASQRRDDREQEWSMLRNELFQDGSRGHTIEVGKNSWKLARGRSGAEPDTIEWRIETGRLTRGQSQKLAQDTLLEGSVTPHFPGIDPAQDAWSQADRDFDGLVDPETAAKLDFLEIQLMVRRRSLPGTPEAIDTLRLKAPLLGPG